MCLLRPRSLLPPIARVLAIALLAGPMARAADPQPYTVHVASTRNGALNAALNATSQLQSLRKAAPVGPFALVDRAQQDIGRMQSALDSFGYYRARIRISIDGHALDDPDLPNILQALPAKQAAKVDVAIDTGPLFHLRKVSVEGAVSPAARAAFRLTSGAPAVATDVLAARARLLTALQDEGHAFATVSEPIAYENATLPVLDVTFKANPGPAYVLGPIRFEGLKRVNEAFLRRQLRIHAGQPYSPTAVEDTRTRLLALGVFASVTVRLPPEQQAKGNILPLTFVVVESKRHAVGLNGEYSSDLGVIAGVSWTDRDLFGSAEQLMLHANLIDFGGTSSTGVGYDVGAQLNKPDFLAPNQSLQFTLDALQQDLLAYDQVEGTASANLSRQVSKDWNVGVGINVEQEKIQQTEVAGCAPPYWCHFTLAAVPLSARYDSTGLSNPLLDPTHGMRVSLSVQPTKSLVSNHATFLIAQANVSTYFDFATLGWSGPGRSVLAVRALAGEASGASQFSLPPDQRFYAGGSATVRGYAYQSVGPTFPPPDTPGEYPEGGAGLAAGSVELRQRLWGNFGMAVFVDAGEVTETPQLLSGTCRDCSGVGVGLGPRYYTPIGPIRLDVALPLKHLPYESAFEAYIGLGQAF